ncbi:hypothetical protein ACOSQ2_021158 [Xanthoceras sorbifolium]
MVYYATPDSVNDQAWYVDSGATNHAAAYLNNLSIKNEYRGKDKLIVGNGNHLYIFNIGSTTIKSHTAPMQQLHLNNILHVSSITENLLNISKLTRDNNVYVEFHDNGCVIKGKRTRRPILQGPLSNGLY